MKLFIDIVMKRIYLFNIVAWNYRKKIGFPVCKKENLADLQAHRKRGKSARASPTPHHTLNEERSARFTAQPLSALVLLVCIQLLLLQFLHVIWSMPTNFALFQIGYIWGLFKSLPCFQCCWNLQGIVIDTWSRDCQVYKKNYRAIFWIMRNL